MGSAILRNPTFRARGAWHPWPPGPLTTVNSTTCDHRGVYDHEERKKLWASGWPVGPHSLTIVTENLGPNSRDETTKPPYPTDCGEGGIMGRASVVPDPMYWHRHRHAAFPP